MGGTRVERIPILEARTAPHLEMVRSLFLEYRSWLADHREITAFDDSILARGLEFMDREIAGLPGEYTPPTGTLLLARQGAEAIGCAALRRQDAQAAELKRVYVRPSSRGGGIGRRLTTRALEEARLLGYKRVVLDTLPTMTSAIEMYRRKGFRPIDAYWANPVPGALFYEYLLDGP
jgi:GNAT superfamily N-acetyltransferase